MKIVVSDGEEDRKNSDQGFLKSVFAAGGIVVAWIFVTGWSYLYTYYEYFGVNINSLEFPIYHYLIFCFAQFASLRWTGVLIGLLVAVVFLLTWAGAVLKRKSWAIVVSLGYLMLFWVGFRIAVADGVSRAVLDMGVNSSLPLVSIEFKKVDQTFKYGITEQTLESPSLRLLLSNGDRLFVFVPVDTRQEIVAVRVVEVDREDVVAAVRTVRIKTR